MADTPCPNCGGSDLFKSQPVDSRARGTDLLPGLHPWYAGGKFHLIVCRGCGLTRFFAAQDALDRIEGSKAWKAII